MFPGEDPLACSMRERVYANDSFHLLNTMNDIAIPRSPKSISTNIVPAIANPTVSSLSFQVFILKDTKTATIVGMRLTKIKKGISEKGSGSPPLNERSTRTIRDWAQQARITGDIFNMNCLIMHFLLVEFLFHCFRKIF